VSFSPDVGLGPAPDTDFVARGAVGRLFKSFYRQAQLGEQPGRLRADEYLIEGPAGTGKTRGVLELFDWFATEFPGSRMLLTRATRAALTESVLVTLEDHVWGGRPHPAKTGFVARERRATYTWPEARVKGEDGIVRSGRSHAVLGSMEHPDRFMSTEYDLACMFEATEIRQDALEKVTTRLRNGRSPIQALIADCNPGPRSHYLNRRAARGRMVRLRSRHRDNPVLYDSGTGTWTPRGLAYLAKLDRLTGARRDRLLRGLWVTDTGLLYEEYEPATHLLRGGLVRTSSSGALKRTTDGRPILRVDSWGGREIPMCWFFASQDWGYANPGSQSVWGVDANDRIFQVYQVYRRERTVDWWAGVLDEFHRELRMQAVVCDHDLDNIKAFNDRLGLAGGRETEPLAVPANKAWEAGCDMVRWALTGTHPQDLTNVELVDKGPLPPRSPRVYFMEDNLRHGPDPGLFELDLPYCTPDELEGLVFRDVPEDQDISRREQQDPTCPNHGADELRYAVMWKWKRHLPVSPPPPAATRGTLAHMLDHDEVWRKAGREGWGP
jgi:phage terminase large subunit